MVSCRPLKQITTNTYPAVANARIEGLTTDLGMTGNQYLTGLTLYFVGYVIFEVSHFLGSRLSQCGLTSIASLQHHSQTNVAQVLAPDFDCGLGNCGDTDGCHSEPHRLFHRTLFVSEMRELTIPATPFLMHQQLGRYRIRSISRCRLLSEHVVQEERTTISHLAFL